MIELRKYGRDELFKILNTNSKQGITRKLNRWGISYTDKGRGANLEITITSIDNPFKVYCITELGFSANTDFYKVRNLYYAFFNGDKGNPVSRQSIANYLEKLYAKELIHKNTGEYIYYFALKQKQRFVERAEYIKAWHEYWQNIDDGMCSRDAIGIMIFHYGGVARKQEKPTINLHFHQAEITCLCDLIQESIENEQQN